MKNVRTRADASELSSLEGGFLIGISESSEKPILFCFFILPYIVCPSRTNFVDLHKFALKGCFAPPEPLRTYLILLHQRIAPTSGGIFDSFLSIGFVKTNRLVPPMHWFRREFGENCSKTPLATLADGCRPPNCTFHTVFLHRPPRTYLILP